MATASERVRIGSVPPAATGSAPPHMLTPWDEYGHGACGLSARCVGQGTLVRVFALPSGERLHQFRRGTYPVTISSLAFSPDSTMIVVSSESDTVHVFRMDDAPVAATAYAPHAAQSARRLAVWLMAGFPLCRRAGDRVPRLTACTVRPTRGRRTCQRRTCPRSSRTPCLSHATLRGPGCRQQVVHPAGTKVGPGKQR